MYNDSPPAAFKEPSASAMELLLCAILEELSAPALILGRKGQLIAMNHRFELATHYTLSQLRYLKKIRQLSIHRPGQGDALGRYELTIYGRIYHLSGRRVQIEGDLPYEFLLFSNISSDAELEEPSLSFKTLIGRSKPFLAAVESCRRAQSLGQYTLLCGESGTGKETLARCMHLESPFPNRKFICLHNNLEFTEFFSAAPLLDTDWYRNRLHEHTLYIDEVANFNHYNQDRLFFLLRNSLISDYKIICATSADLNLLLRRNEWHRNLYAILMSQCIFIPPLRQRKEDIIPLAEHYLMRANNTYNRRLRLGDGLSRRMQEYDWPGNIYELEGFLLSAVRVSPAVDGELAERYLEDALAKTTPEAQSSSLSLAQAEKELILRALNTFSDAPHPKKSAAKALGISLATLYRKLELYSIKKYALFDD